MATPFLREICGGGRSQGAVEALDTGADLNGGKRPPKGHNTTDTQKGRKKALPIKEPNWRTHRKLTPRKNSFCFCKIKKKLNKNLASSECSNLLKSLGTAENPIFQTRILSAVFLSSNEWISQFSSSSSNNHQVHCDYKKALIFCGMHR